LTVQGCRLWVTNRLVSIKLPSHSRGKIVPRAHMPTHAPDMGF
jgi:hypothetical protein